MSTQIQIRVKGQLNPKFSSWFDGLAISHTSDGDTLLTGSARDQAALHGLLARCRDYGLTLVSLNPVAPEAATVQSETGRHS